MILKTVRSKRVRWGLVSLLALGLLVGVALPQFIPAQAAVVTDGLDVEIIAAYNLVVDSNVMSPSTKQPVVATVIGKFCNTDPSDTLTNVVGYIGDYGGDGPGELVSTLASATERAKRSEQDQVRPINAGCVMLSRPRCLPDASGLVARAGCQGGGQHSPVGPVALHHSL